MTALPDPARSRAVLIGTASYRHLSQLPAVEAGVVDLAAELCDATVWGLPVQHCTVVTDPLSPQTILDPVYRASEEATDTLLVYFAGHGMRDADSADLYLALGDSREHLGYTAVAYQHLRTALRSARARRKVVVLDCCFSGRAARALSGSDVLAAEAAVDGAYVLTASPRDRIALAPDGERYTAFTGELLTVLRHGVEDGPELIDLDTLYRVLLERLRAKNRPLPQHSQENGVGRLPLARNKSRAARRTTPAGPVLAADVRAAMVSTGLAVARLLRAEGNTRDALPVLRLALQEQQTAGAQGDLLTVQLELSELLAETGQVKDAIEVLELAFQQVHKVYGPEAVLVCRRLADLLQESGNHLQACEVLKHALDIGERGGPA
ncbi:caspase family protein [Streptomyces phaeoluteigriseus]|uniref:Caspase family protein n=1 Tax=Streptomyces phaeoluteigriseus TaxID=114686 RepID=A0ABY4ZEQ5_9ACTN|nr:caspase family protein [Streptomyces phaeoluteigriseus]USQ87225.1 caspase family protein [Streptomyces phaeoluteigriseus]